jgi:Peptide-N-glycosidase F, C terminal
MSLRAWLIGAASACSACSSKPLTPAAGADASVAPPPAPTTQTIVVFDSARISSDERAPNFQRIAADIELSGGPYQSAKLIADLGTTCFPFSGWADDKPPPGQNYPADCDAFDRNFEIALDEPDTDSGAPPGLELVRAITPFGGPMQVEQDLTALANALPGSHRLSTRINTYSDGAGLISGSNGGWNVSLRLELVSGMAPQHALAVVPLFYGDMLTADSASASFTTPPGTRTAYLEYRTTGHGQAAGDLLDCSGPAEEFCRRTHTVQLDGVTLETFRPWRTCSDACTLVTDSDAGLQYCAENPCGDIASVKAPRANWCPGSETPPIVLNAPELAAPGTHELSWQVADIASGGLVRISLTYYAFGD